MKLRSLLFPLVGLALSLPFACGDDDSDTVEPGPSGEAGATGAAGASEAVGASYTCEICECLPDNPMRPAEVYDVVEILLETIEGRGDPGNTYVGIMPNHQSTFWDTPNLGFNAAKDELGCLGDWHWPPAKTEPVETIVQDQTDTLLDWTEDGGDYDKANAVALSAKSAADLVGPIDDTVEADIPVITFDSDAVNSQRTLYLGALNEPAGTRAGETLLDLLGADFPGSTGTVVVLAGEQTAANIAERVAGIQAAFDAEDAGDQLDIRWDLTDPDIAGTLDTAYAAEGEDLVGVIALLGTFGGYVGDWIATNELDATVNVVTWDTSEAVVTHMEAGNIDATMVQRAYFYGYLSTYVAYAMAVVGVDDTMAALSDKLTGDNGDLLNTGIDVLTPDNLEDYNTYSTECLKL